MKNINYKIDILDKLKNDGITISQLSRELSISRGFLSDILHGKRDCSISILNQIRDRLNLKWDEVFCESNNNSKK